MTDLGEALDALDIGEWLDSQAIDYRENRGSRGMQLNIKECPVCGNASWKVYLNAETGLGNCFAGDHPPGENFNKWKFIRACTSDVSTAAVIESVKLFSESRGWRPKRVKSEKVNEKVEWEMPAHLPLPIKGRNLKYLENRGVDLELATYFHLGYCASGYFRYKVYGDWRFMDFSKRILIPIYDLDGKLKTFQGRDITGTHERKYLFPPGLAATGALLYNGHNVKDTHRVVVGEGAFDVIAIKRAMDEDPALRDVVPVGTFGKHLSHGPGDTQQMRFLDLRNRGVSDVTLMWDGEVRATDDAVQAGLVLTQLGFQVRVAMLPPMRDPNEVVPSVVRRAFYEAIPLTRLGAAKIMLRRREMNRNM